MNQDEAAAELTRVVAQDLCIGCGLCESASQGAISMEMTTGGSLRPAPLTALAGPWTVGVAAACPGRAVRPRTDPQAVVDDVWGGHRRLVMAWAADPEVRFRAAAGGVLTALAQHLLRTTQAAFVLHVGPDPQRPTRSTWRTSETPAEVAENSGSWYGPTAPLAGLETALARDEPFAIAAKPCDLAALDAFARHDERVDRLCVARLAMVCGGQSRFTKTQGLLDQLGVDESSVVALRYRGDGNPGPTRVDTAHGASHQIPYLQMWADESSWDIETRCKLCPDALGECADVAAADTWPGGAPTGEDPGFNAVVVRTATGEDLVAGAEQAGALTLGPELTIAQLDDMQPHQVRKKVALAARYAGMRAAGVQPIETSGLRISRLGERMAPADRVAEAEGTARRLGG